MRLLHARHRDEPVGEHYQSCGGHTSRDTINDVLAGNLCRCTGYRPIVNSALEVCKTGADDQFTRKAAARLQAIRTPANSPSRSSI